MKYLVSASILALSVATQASAQEPFQLGTITLFTNQTATTTARSGATVEVVEAKEVQKASDTRLVDYLSSLPGVSASTNGGLGGTGTLRVRGLGGEYLAVRIDGIDVTDPSRPQNLFDWNGLTLGGVSRIELLKGSQSAGYGAGAVAGVINITTLRAEEEGTSGQASLEVGSFGTVQAGVSIANKSDRAEISLGLNRVTTDGFSASSLGVEADGYEATQLTFGASYQITDAVKVGLSLYAVDSYGEFDEFGGDGAAPFDEYNESTTRAGRVYAEFQTGAVKNELSFSALNGDRTSNSDGVASPFSGTRRSVEYKGSVEQSEALTLSWGASFVKEGFDAVEEDWSVFPPLILTPSGSVETKAVFAEALYAPAEDLDLSLTVRHDDHSSFGSKTTGRAALAWRIQPDLILRASAATGFLPPSLYELHSQVYGNPALQPEESKSFEIGLEKRYGDDAFAKVTFFSTEVTNRIDYDFLTNSYQQVTGDTKIQGMELSGRTPLSERIALFGSYTLTRAEGPNGGKVVRVPQHDFVLGVDAALTDRLSGTLTVNRIAERYDGFVATRAPDYTLVNLSVNYAISAKAEAYLRIENLLDEQYQSVSNYNSSGRAAYFGVRTSF